MAVTKKYADDFKVSDMCISDFPQGTYGFTPSVELLFFHFLLGDPWSGRFFSVFF